MANSPFTSIHATSTLMECVFLCDRYEIYDSPTPTPSTEIQLPQRRPKSWTVGFCSKGQRQRN